MSQGSFGQLRVFDDFLAPDNDLTWGTGTVKVGNFGFISVNEGTLEWTVDEPGGILAATTDTGDNDNFCLMSGTYKPADGGMAIEARFKFSDATLFSVFVGFTETLVLATPVMPAEFATATMTYNGTGGMVGIQGDSDGTTIDFRAVQADGAASLDSSNLMGVRANATITSDAWYVARVIVNKDGTGEVWFGDATASEELQLVKRYTGKLTTTDIFYAAVIGENRSAAAKVYEIDYIDVKGFRDWAP